MRNDSPIKLFNFNSGEVSPYIWYRSDLQKYGNSCKTLENFLVSVQGAARRRKGTKYLADISATGEDIRLIPFEFSTSDSNVLLLYKLDGVVKMKVFSQDGEQLIDDLDTPFGDIDLSLIQYIQSYDVIFFTHPDNTQVRLSRYASDDWVFDIDFITVHPALDVNVNSSTTFTLSAVDEGGSMPIWSSTSTYSEGDTVYVEPDLSNATSSGIESYSINGAVAVASPLYACRLIITKSDEYSNFAVGDVVSLSGLSGTLDVYTKNTYTKWAKAPNATEYAHSYMTINSSSTFLVTAISGSSVYIKSIATVNVSSGMDYAGYSNSYSVQSVSGTLTLSTGATIINISNAAIDDDGVSGYFYYTAIQDVPTGIEIDNTAYWVGTVFSYNTQMNITSSEAFFEEGRVGQQLTLYGEDSSYLMDTWGSSSQGTTSATLYAYGTVTLRPEGGVWTGTLALQQSRDGGETWETIGRTYSVDGSANVEIIREITELNMIVRVYMEEREAASGDTGCSFVLSVTGESKLVVQVEEIISETEAICSLKISSSSLGYTNKWAEGSWCPMYGYPSAINIFEERLFFGGTDRQPNTVHGSATNNWVDFSSGTLDTSAVSFQLASGTFDKIQALMTKQNLVIFTDKNEWSLGSRSTYEALTGSNVFARKESEYGADNFMPVPSESHLFFIRNGGKKLANIVYNYNYDFYESDDMSVLAEHLLDSGVRQLCRQGVPDSVIWVLCNDGSIATFTYMPKQEVSGWSKQTFGDGVVTICTMRNGDSDNVYLAVKRGDSLCLESYDSDVAEYTDCYNDEDKKVAYTSTIEPLPILLGQDAYGRTVILKGVSLYLIDSQGGEISVDGGKTYIDIRKYLGNSYKTGSINGEIQMTLNSGHRTTADISIKTDAPYPFDISAIGVYGAKRGGE